MCTFGVLGLSCKAPAAPKPPGFRTTAREPLVTFPKALRKDKNFEHSKDDLRSWGLKNLCICSSSGDIPGETTKFQLCDIPSTSSFIFGCPAAFTTPSVVMMGMLPPCVMSKTRSNMHLWLHSTCNCPCYHWGGGRLNIQSLQRAERRILVVKASAPILKKLIAPAVIVSIHFMVEWDSTIFPTCASRVNFRVCVCLFTSARPFVTCSPTGRTGQLNKWRCQQGRSLESFDRWLSITSHCHLAEPESTQQRH